MKPSLVCGSLQFRGTTESTQTEGIYWKYEGMLRLMEARVGATLTASGAIYALRRECYQTIESDTLIEDFVIPMNARAAGYKVLYDPEVTATEFAALNNRGKEFPRLPSGLAVGSFRALGTLLRVRLDAMTYVAFFSHKVLRWIVAVLLIGLWLSNAWIGGHGFYGLRIGCANLFLRLGVRLGLLAHKNHRRQRILLLVLLLGGYERGIFNRFRCAWRSKRDQAVWRKASTRFADISGSAGTTCVASVIFLDHENWPDQIIR